MHTLAITPHPTRFHGFAALPMAVPIAAARELERAVTTLGFKGAMVDNHLNLAKDGSLKHYDSSEYDILWETAQRLDVPIYIHPAPPSQETIKSSRFSSSSGPSAYPEPIALALAGPG